MKHLEPKYWYLPAGTRDEPPRLLTWEEYSMMPFNHGATVNYGRLLPVTFLAEADWEFAFPEPEHQQRWEEIKRYLRREEVYQYLVVPVEEWPLWQPRQR